MKKVFITTSLAVSSIASGFSRGDTLFPVQHFKTLPHISIRALEVLNDSTAWFAANHGTWGYTENAGITWHIDSIKADSVYPEFRSIAVLNDSTALLLSIASPAYLFKTTNKGKTWRLVYKNTHKGIFFDSMKFMDHKTGMAVADPIDGHFYLIASLDGGENWHAVDSTKIFNSLAKEGESFFASSNTNIAYSPRKFWLATGGKYARVIIGGSGGPRSNFLMYDTPMTQGGKMTGIFSIDFLNDTLGVIAGGDYEKTDRSVVGLAITKDGGKTWKATESNIPFFGSCVRFRSANEFFVTGHDGTFACNFKTGKTEEVKDRSNAQLKFHTLRFSPSGRTVWLAGGKGMIARISFRK